MPRGSNQRVVVNESATILAQEVAQYTTFYSFGSMWVIIKTGTGVGYYVNDNLPITLPPDTYDFILNTVFPLTAAPAGLPTWLWGEVARGEDVRALYGNVNISPPEEPQP